MLDKNVLCFTTSFRRPYYLYNVINCILNQTFSNFLYYVNISIETENEEIFYKYLLKDFDSDKRLNMIFSYNDSQFQNYLKPILAAEKNKEYDIFVKIDDDDIYHKNYLSTTINYFTKNDTDILSLTSNFYIEKNNIIRKKLENIAGVWNEDKNSEVKFGLSPTYIFNRKAFDIIKKISESGENTKKIHPFEDAVWRYYWRKNNLKSLIINDKDLIFTCHRHENNVSNFYEEKPQCIDNDNARICLFKHPRWRSYIYLNKKNNRAYNINNEDHGEFILTNDTVVIDWDHWGKETFVLSLDNNIITYEHK